MSLTIAIHPEPVRKNSRNRTFAPDWIRWLEERGHSARVVDAMRSDVIESIRGADGFMWRHAHRPTPRLLAKRILHTVERYLGIPTFPDWDTGWHYDDKVTQAYMFEAAGIPTPKTRVFWNRDEALEFLAAAEFPMVLKLAGGASSQNVRKLDNRNQAERWVRRLFDTGAFSLEDPVSILRLIRHPRTAFRRLKLAMQVLQEGIVGVSGNHYEIGRDYVYLQEFLPDNAYDTRITIIGDRAFGFRRLNRPDSFTASGSGLLHHEPEEIDQQFIRLAFRLARALNTQSVAIDGMYRGDAHVIGEISFTYASYAVYDCPGHWVLDGDPEVGELRWVDGQMWPQIAIIEDFVEMLLRRRES